ncbi:pantoate--beta-alanine ligase [Nocardia cyriacigeorgica]|uniref:pantoate--beta-alanine ligase n=2 Tax=Nocardia cyriacigeorgica TaxID=135487 RepID=UPI000CE9B9B8|nr:pantoate--beta-alanine ligase [Nocardia cyriacigeorgica]AVH25007.1 pantoate--beta-alanine ligase [Nocardia cyriacigeorgica]MBF6324683.1 pantoate--beta-alanine ligase [Nocardia cyriacigeorgica]PPJ07658.1 pantoate--beta-alanine ligase [Nocardia cyriacigeorgica]TLF58344.1 pantoate--beta-alanine ligase [Nocardia cyriacigeorgica]
MRNHGGTRERRQFDSAYTPGELNVLHDPSVVAAVSKALRGVGRSVGLVPTMGALHEGHLELVRRAKRTNTIVIVSIFVNPLQFGAGEDLDKYPRTLDADVELLRAEGVDIVFAPSVADMYPDGPRTTVHPGPLGAELEGGTRPTHFAGMLTVVAKLLQIAKPNEAFFGEKDYQQLTLIRQMVRDLNFDVSIVAVPTVREADGLALSSRNRYLDPRQRETATALSAALIAGARAAGAGPESVLAAARAVLDAVPGLDLDYLELRSSNLDVAPASGNARLLIAAKVGATRLIDNMPVVLGATIDGHPNSSTQPAQVSV